MVEDLGFNFGYLVLEFVCNLWFVDWNLNIPTMCYLAKVIRRFANLAFMRLARPFGIIPLEAALSYSL